MNTVTLTAIGFWKVTPEDHFVYPQELPTTCYPDDLFRWITGYFAHATVIQRWRGFSQCRYQCGIQDEDMGSCDHSDGEFVWPEGYPHYVRVHSLALPERLLTAIRDRRGICPDGSALAYDSRKGAGLAYQYAYWSDWCARLSNGDTSRTQVLIRRFGEMRESSLVSKQASLVRQFAEDPHTPCIYAGCERPILRGKKVCWYHSGQNVYE